MRGGVHLVAYLLLVSCLRSTRAVRCDREPPGHTSLKSEADNRFKIKISGNPDKYVPGEVYTVSLQGERIQHNPQKFTGFMLVVEPSNGYLPSWGNGMPRSGSMHEFSNRNVGTFSLFGDALTKFSDHCPNAVIQTSSIPKSDIQVLWTAPSQGSGCVVFRATVVESRDYWYMDDGPLSRVLCEDVQENDDDQPEVVNPCCACEEAKYEVTFEGLWSRHTHPKDFPTNGWLTRFSDVIGASHSADYRFWDYGGFASEGLRQVAERGATRMLESELKAQSEHIRTIIKARGISFPNVTGKTFAVFRVDRKHHLMSIVSMIDPSPDWIVGVSRLELCLRNCSWVEHKVLNLYPWDAGTDSGITYISPDMPTSPREVIRRITSSFPNDPRSPFYDPTGSEMKPLARLYLTRQRLYEKSCSDDPSATSLDYESGESTDSGDCEVTEWTQWSSCSVTCGNGVKHKQRFFVNPMRAQIKPCTTRLTARYACTAEKETCGPNSDESTDIPLDPICAVTEWSQWSNCSVSCGRGVRTRTRKYQIREAYKRCSPHSNAPVLEQNDECYGVEGPCDSQEDSQEGAPNCPVTGWSSWSPCSVTCGKGKRLRTRLPVAYNEETERIYEHLYDGYNNPLSMEDCADAKIFEEVDCIAPIPSCEITASMAKEICQLPKEEGSCTGNNSRWYFDSQEEGCVEFTYSGCRGNKNNFLTLEHCESVCKNYKEDLRANRTARLQQYGVSLSGVISYNLQGSGRLDQNCEDEEEDISVTSATPPDHKNIPSLSLLVNTTTTTTTESDGEAVGLVVDCEVTRWSPWSECDVTCGRGYKSKSRTIKIHARNGGKACPKKLVKRKKCKRICIEPVDCILSDWTMWSPCSLTCGMNAVKQRTRSVILPNSGGGMPCSSRLEVAQCELLPCGD
ncbi:spondin-1-like isoform X2 [Periplaneta americana]|uniref:spondin-1-like isoform X2 n=1 Tax=Periplaneta americana TaxID=6978 RepID=UPI0037E98504